MNKLWITAIVILSCTIGALGLNYMDPERAAGGISLNKNVSYTDEELQDLYIKYDIKENDLKFARGELPNYLKGTIFESNSKVLVTETGEPPEGLIEGEHYDIVVSEQEMSEIMEETRIDYIEKYGVDPADPKIDDYNGYLLPKQEVRRLLLLEMVTVVE